MKIKHLFSLGLTFLALNLSAQHVSIPPSPNASSLGSYAAIDQVNFLGRQDVSIPITKLRINDTYSIPISLSYRTGGIKVEEISSNVGLGWSLNAGGLITRAVQGFPDDVKNSNFSGYFNNLDMMKNIDQYESQGTLAGKLRSHADNSKDLEPDIFYFNFLGKTGKFLFDKDKNIQFVVFNNFKVTVLEDSDKRIIGFIITDDKGFKYRFEDIEESTVSSHFDDRSPFFKHQDKANYTYNSSWYLTKVITPFNKVVDFHYTVNTVDYRKRPVTIGSKCKNNDCSQFPTVTPNWRAAEYVNYKVKELSLSKIAYENSSIEFSYSAAREDLKNGTVLRSIKKKIEQSNVSLAFSDYWTLSHSYFSSTGGTSNIYKRLKLDDITRHSRDGSSTEVINKFEYNNTSLPHRESYEQDFWGYYNGNNATSLIPKTYVYPSLENTFEEYSIYPIPGITSYHVFPGVDRTPNDTFTKACSLEKIFYATKGSQEFVFESNQFTYKGSTKKGPGLRIKKIIKSDERDHSKDLIYNYMYTTPETNTTSGKIFNLPVHAINTGQNEIAYKEGQRMKVEDGSNKCVFLLVAFPGVPVPVPVCENEGSVSWSDFYTYFYKTERFAVDQSSIGSLNSTIFGYEYISTLLPDGSVQVAQYSMDGSIDQWQNYASGVYASKGDFYVPEVFSYSFSSGSSKIKKNDFSYPFSHNSNHDWKKGRPLSIKSRNSQGNTIKTVTYDYTVNDFGHDVDYIFNRPLKRFNPRSEIIHVLFNTSGTGYSTVENRFSVIKALTNLSYDIKKTTTKHHEGNAVSTSVEEIEYVDNLLYPRGTSSINSKGEVIASKYYYPSDLLQHNITTDDEGDSESLAIDNLIDQNILNVPIEKFSLVDNKITSASLTTFKLEKGFSVIDKSHSFLLSNPVPFNNSVLSRISRTAIPGNDHDYNFSNHSNYETKTSLEVYDSSGNILQTRESDAESTAYIWGYNNSRVTANITNAQSNEVYFTSFEDEQWSDDSNQKAYKYHVNPYSGQYCLNIKSNQFGFSKEINVENENDEYVLSAMIKTPSNFNSGGYANLIVQVLDENTGAQLAWLTTLIGSTNNQWRLFERKVDLSNYSQDVKLKIEVWNSNSNEMLQVDDIRFHPTDALMTSYTYKPITGVTSITDSRREIQRFEYDQYGRLQFVKDANGNIIKTTQYHYRAQ